MLRLIEAFAEFVREAATYETKIGFETDAFAMIDSLKDALTMVNARARRTGWNHSGYVAYCQSLEFRMKNWGRYRCSIYFGGMNDGTHEEPWICSKIRLTTDGTAAR